MTSTTERLAAAILADHARPTAQHNIVPCFVCSHTFVYKGRRGDRNGRCCSMRCQDWCDAGNPVAVTDSINYGMKRGSKGFYIDCAHCRKEFESLGLRCCTTECERAHREREENLVIMAQAGIEPTAKRKCEGPGCNAIISKWHKGRKVGRNKRFCSPKCQQRQSGPRPSFECDFVQEVPVLRGLFWRTYQRRVGHPAGVNAFTRKGRDLVQLRFQGAKNPSLQIEQDLSAQAVALRHKGEARRCPDSRGQF